MLLCPGLRQAERALGSVFSVVFSDSLLADDLAYCVMRCKRCMKSVRNAIECAMIACWGLALILNAQGWTLAGGDWLAADGSSFWSRCGSAMCACGPEAWSVTLGREKEPASSEEICCEDEEARQLAITEQGDDADSAASGSWLSGIGLVALGNHRRQQPEGAWLPEVVVLELPTAGATEIDRLLPLFCAAVSENTHLASRAIEIPVPPPKA